MKKLGGWFLTGWMVFASCTNNTDHTKINDEAIAVEEGPAEVTNEVNLQQSFPSLAGYLQKEDSSFSPEKFTQGETASINSVQPGPIGENLKSYAPFFIYNKDSSLAIDLYSYNYIWKEREGKKTLEAAGPDTEVALIDFAKKTRKRILFSGPSTAILDAQWLTAQELMISGAETIDEEKIKPMMWRINLKDSSNQVYSYPDTVAANAYTYIEEKLKQQQAP